MLGCPTGQLVSSRKLQLAQHVRHVALDGLDGEAKSGRDLLVHVAAGDQLQDLALTWSELVELGVSADALARAEGVEHETGQAWGEDRVAGRDPLDRGRELGARDRLRHVATRARADHR